MQVLLAITSLYQCLFITAFFWTDIVPSIGTSTGVDNWALNFRNGFSCFGDSLPGVERCKYSAMLAFVFALSYACTYLFSSWLMLYSSANYSGLLLLVSNPLVRQRCGRPVYTWFCMCVCMWVGRGAEWRRTPVIVTVCMAEGGCPARTRAMLCCAVWSIPLPL